ncbi:MFS transporter [Actinoplanes sp. LDG1-06]|uniref:MFS transporter n=1 Tax=Paractinoplanes ovalisporus TaxID=2810368 RepID=A0ABS2AMD4_9ACTN|nr:MFS transporter [Actinoplanes ovalisporus]MBM2620994.1 MFS transporter [Actinoplanes ovalisporus]
MLPPAGLPRRLATQSAVLGIGGGTFLTGSVVFFTLYVGLSPIQVGIGFSVAGLVGLVGSLPLGHLADRIGGRRAWVLGALGGAATFALYPFTSGFWTFILLITLEAAADTLANSGRIVYTAAALRREDRVRTMAFTRAYLNVGFTVGSGLGAAALALDSRAGLLVLVLANAVGLVLNAIFVSRMPATPATEPQAESNTPYAGSTAPKAESTTPTESTTPYAEKAKKPSPWGVLRDHPYTALASLFGVLWLNATLFGEVVPLWAITMTDAPRPLLGVLFAINTVMAVALQVRATRGADSLAGSTRLLRWAALASVAACPVVALSGATHGWVTIALLAAAIVLLTATELWMSGAQWYLQTEIPPPDQRGAYMGASKSVGGVTKMIGPASLTFLAIHTGGWGWWLIAAIFLAAWAAAAPIVAWVERTPRNGIPPALIRSSSPS